jgi:lipoprotein-releasing system ATP-binding protein
VTTPIIAARGLKKRFDQDGRTLEVLRGIDLTIGAGERVSIVGPSGAGKSTLLHCLGTLDLPSEGSLQLAGADVLRLPRNDLAKLRGTQLGFVFQFHHLLPEFTALENVMMPGLVQRQPRAALEKQALELLTLVGLAPRATHRPGELSGGEQQRVALARAMVLSPKILFADEPTGNLDSATSAQIQELFLRVSREHGTTLVVVTHDMGLARAMDRIISMRDGSIEHDSATSLTEAST